MTTQPQTFAEALAGERGQPAATFAALERLANESIGARLFTVMALDTDRGRGCRIYTNMPEAYPCFGMKALPEGEWTHTVVGNRRMFIANNLEEIARVFPDYELIASLGCASVLNLPVVAAGRLLGTVNCLDRAGNYSPERVGRANDLVLPATACFLLHGMLTNQGGTD